MDKIYLIYCEHEEYRDPVECDFGVAWPMLYKGALYPYEKGDINRAWIVILVHLCVFILLLMSLPWWLALLIGVGMLFLINFLFALNYNMIVIEGLLKQGYLPMDSASSDKLIEKGIYFKLQ